MNTVLANRIFLRTKEYMLSIPRKRIIYIEAAGSYTWFHVLEPDNTITAILQSGHLKKNLERLDDSFLRISQSVAVNTRHIYRVGIDRNLRLLVADAPVFTISVLYWKKLKGHFGFGPAPTH